MKLGGVQSRDLVVLIPSVARRSGVRDNKKAGCLPKIRVGLECRFSSRPSRGQEIKIGNDVGDAARIEG